MAAFEVIRTRRQGREVCVKRLASTSPEERVRAVATTSTLSNETNIFTWRGFGWFEHEAGLHDEFYRAPSDEYYRALLAAELRVIESAAHEWNHPGAWLDGGDLVMPWCDGTSFAALDRDGRRHWFPRMLPALWRALASCPHGDLKPDSFLIKESDAWFRILDPGVRIAGPAQPRTPTYGLDFDSTVATTNAEHYPLLEPQHGPNRPVGTVRDLHQLLDLGVSHGLLVDPSLDDTVVCGAPAAADLLALGAMYFAILVGRPLAAELGLERPLWCGSWSSRNRGSRGSPRCTQVRDAITAGVIEQALASAAVTSAEAELCAHLVRLRVHEPLLATLAATVTKQCQ